MSTGGTVGCWDVVAATHSPSFCGAGRRLGFPSSSFSSPVSKQFSKHGVRSPLWVWWGGSQGCRAHEGVSTQRSCVAAPSGPWSENLSFCYCSYCKVCHNRFSFLLNGRSQESSLWRSSHLGQRRQGPAAVASFWSWLLCEMVSAWAWSWLWSWGSASTKQYVVFSFLRLT